jgi:hypothetical protein
MMGLQLLLAGGILAVASGAAVASQLVQRQYPRYWPGVRWEIAFGSYEGVERFAVDELQRMAQLPFLYVLKVGPAKGIKPAEREHLILVGTAKNNSLLRQLIEHGKLQPPKGTEGYSVACLDSPWKQAQRVIAVVGTDPNGVLYGVEDLNARVLADNLKREQFDGLKDFAFSEAPAIRYRGIWSWAYVIYDYRRFFDHMARLKMNTAILWNDVLPLNCREVIDYAHSRGVRVVLGFQWGWGVDRLNLADPAQRKAIKREVLANYRDNYRSLPIDGIYFQTSTENNQVMVGGKSTAQLACDWVNDIAAEVFKASPKLRIEFGLHGSSIRDHYLDLKLLDPRITITWEDVGVLPYSYDPVLPDPADAESADPYRSLKATIDYSKKIAAFRANKEFSIVAKGWIQLPWQTSEHHGEYIVGERDRAFIVDRLAARHERWDFVNSLWEKNYPLAARFYREVLACGVKRMAVTGLIEDGMFEERIQPSVALFAATLWNPYAPDDELLRRASSEYYSR